MSEQDSQWSAALQTGGIRQGLREATYSWVILRPGHLWHHTRNIAQTACQQHTPKHVILQLQILLSLDNDSKEQNIINIELSYVGVFEGKLLYVMLVGTPNDAIVPWWVHVRLEGSAFIPQQHLGEGKYPPIPNPSYLKSSLISTFPPESTHLRRSAPPSRTQVYLSFSPPVNASPAGGARTPTFHRVYWSLFFLFLAAIK